MNHYVTNTRKPIGAVHCTTVQLYNITDEDTENSEKVRIAGCELKDQIANSALRNELIISRSSLIRSTWLDPLQGIT